MEAIQRSLANIPVVGNLFKIKDPRWMVLACLGGYVILGFTILGFNRTPTQAAVTTLCCMAMDAILCRYFKGKWIFPLSAIITSCSLSILLNYSHDYWVLLAPVFFAIGTKYIFTFNGKHNYNPAQVAVTLSLIFCGSVITSAPAYQWYGLESISILVVFLGFMFVLPQVNRLPLVITFLICYTLQTLLRAWIMQHHLPFQTLFLGSITSPAFFLFTFFMITDPATSPNSTKDQIKAGIALAVLDLIFHIGQSYYTFFYAGFTLQSWKLLKNHFLAMRQNGSPLLYFKERFLKSGYWKRPLILGSVFFVGMMTYKLVLHPTLAKQNLPFHFDLIPSTQSGIKSELGDTLYRTDKRLHHIVKWVLSVGDSVATGDFDNDGLVDIFLSNTLKKDGQRAALYKNLGNFKFERVLLPSDERFIKIEQNGLPSNGLFVDYDNDGDTDLFIMVAFGEPVLLQNQLSQTGKATFLDVTQKTGLDKYVNGIAATFADFDRDGRLDLLVGHVWPRYLPGYPQDKPEKLNVFKLPQPQYEGDLRMFNFMHSSWHLSDNGGVNEMFKQNVDGTFEQLDSKKIGIPEHYWTLALGTADFNHDGWVDLYVANDFGPDNFYLNQKNFTFKKIEGDFFGSLGRDTYKGMNASVEDVDADGFQDVYISNVHHEMQAEGSLFWFFGLDKDGKFTFEDKATKLGALNENRFGWGASFADYNNDGWLELVQANGMVDDRPDKRFENCKDYWYTNEKIARSPPEIHRYIHFWGDIRGYCIYPNEKKRFYLHSGRTDKQMYDDVADAVGLGQGENSRGIASADFDNDGLMDMIVSNQFAEPHIFKNNWTKGEKPHWLGLDLASRSPDCNRMALGTTLAVHWNDGKNKRVQYKELKLANGFSAQNESRTHLGLGASVVGPVEVEINWCQKHLQRVSFDSIDRYVRIVLDGTAQL
ncbi:MAG: FG-GAP-like repeat-containing protein [Bacteriovoracaceae bacterium]|nr:FG-GAP-like repeat-containing protein [Bacteriovoracaceae bacterium]